MKFHGSGLFHDKGCLISFGIHCFPLPAFPPSFPTSFPSAAAGAPLASGANINSRTDPWVMEWMGLTSPVV